MRALKWIVLAFVVIVGGAVAFLLTLDVNKYKPEIIALVENATGRKLAIGGDLKLALLPPAITVKGITFSNAAGGSRPAMLTAGEFSAEVDLMPLLSGQIKVNRLMLADVDLLLEKDRQGRGNWEFGTSAAAQPPQQPAAGAAAGGGIGNLPVISDLLLKNIKLAYRDAGTKAAYDAVVSELSLKSRSGGELAARLVAKLDGNDVTADGTFGSLAELMQPTKPWPVKLNLTLPGAKASVDGSIKEPLQGKGYALKIAAEAPDIARLAALAKQKAPSFGPLTVTGMLGDQAGEPGLGDLRVVLGADSPGRIIVTGAVRQLLAQKGLQLNIDFATPDLKTFAAKFDAAVAQAVPVTFKAQLRDAAPQRYAFSGIAATVAGSDLAGSGEAALGGPKPVIRFDLASKSMDLVPLLGGSESKAAAAPAGAKTAGGGAAASSEARLFSNDPLPLDALDLADADIKYRADLFKAPHLAAQAVSVTLQLKDGALSVRPFGLGISGGTLSGEVGLNSRTKAISVKLDGRGIGLSEYLKAEKITDVMSRGGKTDLAVDLTGQGASVRQIMAGLNGKVLLKVGEGELRDQYLDFLGADVLGVLGKIGQATAKTKLECVVTGIDIRNGMATPKAILAETGRLSATAAGTINLATEQLSMKVVPSSRDATLASLVPPLNVSGTLANPSVLPDTAAVAKGVAGAVAGAALLGPAAILSPLLGGGGGGSGDTGAEACAKAIALAEGRPVPQTRTAPSPQQQQPAQKQPPANPLQDLGKGLGGLFKR